MRGIEGAKQTRRLVSKLVPAMSDTSRGAALTAILSGLSSEQKASAFGDAFETLATGTSDIIAVLKEVIEALNADDRAKLLLSTLKETPSEERVAILSSLLERISPNELARSLSMRAQNVSLLSAMPQEMLATKQSERKKKPQNRRQ